MPPDAVIVRALRTPVGKYGGVLREIRPDDLSAMVIGSLVQSTGIDGDSIDDVFWGCANQAGEDNRNVARMATLLAGLPYSVPAATVNRLCGSSLEALIQAARAIRCGDAHTVIAGGVESMSRAPYAVAKNTAGAYGNLPAYDTALGWRFPNTKMAKRFPLETMGETAENVAAHYGIGREEQDVFALESHRKAVRAQTLGLFAQEIVPVDVPQKGGAIRRVDADEGPRADTSLEKLAALPPVFRTNGTVTAGNSSTLNDGASGVMLMSAERARHAGLRPVARVVSAAVAGVDPRMMGIGPVPATRKALRAAGLSIGEIGLVELNEAFAAQSIAVLRDLGIAGERVNQAGGAIALGHPLGCSGTRILTTLLHLMVRSEVKYGLATMCIGVGQGIAVIVENCSSA
ncbi:MAG TPA: thiolase family protein [Bacteroidota bacterium]|nr:thiolase family protein [Bacteroidota bacterium]